MPSVTVTTLENLYIQDGNPRKIYTFFKTSGIKPFYNAVVSIATKKCTKLYNADAEPLFSAVIFLVTTSLPFFPWVLGG